MSAEPILLVGCGKMGRAHAAVLRALGRPIVALDRDAVTADGFAREHGFRPIVLDVQSFLARTPEIPRTAIVAVNVPNLVEVSIQLMERGCRRLLVEKPGASTLASLHQLSEAAAAHSADIVLGYNRRYYASVERARELIEADGGPLAVKFDFTEAAARIAKADYSVEEKANWFFLNSTHVVDIAFFIAGSPVELVGEASGALAWHPPGGIFVGHGRTDRGAAISYHANWLAPGRWGVEVTTKARRLVMQPLEELACQTWDGFALTAVPLDDELDRKFKPGVYRQLAAFLSELPDTRQKTIAQQVVAWSWYERIVEQQDEGAAPLARARAHG